LVAVGALDAGSITSGFTSINAPIIGTASGGVFNTAIGNSSGAALAAGSFRNICLGDGAGNDITTGDDNVLIGYGAGDTIVLSSGNTCIGSDTSTSETDSSGQIAIGYAVSCVADSTVTIGFGSNTASLGLDGTDTSWAPASSDERLKENIETSTAGLGLVNDLRPVNYNWKKAKDVPVDMPQYVEGSDEPVLGYEYGKTFHGFIAQECRAAIDKHRSSLADGFNLWIERDNGTQTVADGNLIPVLVRAVQELSSKIDSLESRLAALE